MRHIAAYLLASIGEPNTEPKKEKIKSILGSVGVEADEKQLDIVIEKFAGKVPNKVIAEGKNLLALPQGGVAMLPGASAGGAPAAPGGKPAAAAAPAKSEPKKEEKKEEPEEESDEDMGFGLFD